MQWYMYLILIVGALFYSWVTTNLFKRNMQSMQDRLMSIEEGNIENLSESILSKGFLNHFRWLIADGGIGYLLQDRLVFVPHKLNLPHGRLVIPFSDIVKVSDYKILGIIDTGVKITMKSGKVEKFVFDKTSDLYRSLMNTLGKDRT